MTTPVALVLGLMSQIVGVRTDQFGPRRVVIASAVTMAAGLPCCCAGSICSPVILADRGAPTSQAALAMSVVGVSLTTARFLFGALMDRWPALLLTAGAFMGSVAGHLLLATVHNRAVPMRVQLSVRETAK
jgi:MFS family permease